MEYALHDIGLNNIITHFSMFSALMKSEIVVIENDNWVIIMHVHGIIEKKISIYRDYKILEAMGAINLYSPFSLDLETTFCLFNSHITKITSY